MPHSLFAIFTNTFTYLQIRSLQDHKRRSCSIVFNPTLCNCAYYYNGSRRKDKYCHVAQGNTFMPHVLVCYWACGLLNANKSLPLIGCFQMNFIDLAWNQALDVMCWNKCSFNLLNNSKSENINITITFLSEVYTQVTASKILLTPRNAKAYSFDPDFLPTYRLAFKILT